MSFHLILYLCLLSLALARQTSTDLAPAPSAPPKVSMISLTPARAPSNSPKIHSLTPARAPAYSPETHGYFPRPYVSKHRRRIPHAVLPPSFTPPQDPGCDEVFCTDPLTLTPIGSPCGCVFPMQVEIDLEVAPYQLFSRIAELEVEVAAGTFLKQSQVRIMGASASIQDPGKTTVNIDLLPLGNKFDNMTAFLTYERLWQKKVPINMTIFGDYDVIYVHYPGLPSSPPTMPGGSFGPSGVGSHQYPLTANLPTSKTRKINFKTIAVIALFSSILVLICFVAICLVWRCKRLGRAPTTIGPAFTSSVTRKTGPDKMKAPFDWDTRMKIALGAARGLAYLHEDSNPRVIHRDFKASNVLLEDDFTPKVSDFGLAREASEGIHHISTRVMGTFGYVAPEYAMTGHLLVKSDVYSYGVVLLELLSGRKPVDISQPHGSENLVTWARPLLTTREGLEQLIDPSLGPNYDFDTMAKVAAIASLCVHIEASQRPFMGEVVQALKLIYSDVDETYEDSCSQMESSSGADCGLKGDFGPEGSWWNGSSPHLTMEYSSGYTDERGRPHSESLVGGHNRSGPPRTKEQKSAFYRLRGSVSEHGHQQSRRSCYDGNWV